MYAAVVEHVARENRPHHRVGSQFFGGFDCLFHKFRRRFCHEVFAEAEVLRKTRGGESGFADNDVPDLNACVNRTRRAHSNYSFHAVKIEQLIAVDSYRRHAHARRHNGNAFAVVVAGVALNAADVVNQNDVRQKVFCDKFCAKRIARH